jgi:hypothetical protein
MRGVSDTLRPYSYQSTSLPPRQHHSYIPHRLLACLLALPAMSVSVTKAPPFHPGSLIFTHKRSTAVEESTSALVCGPHFTSLPLSTRVVMLNLRFLYLPDGQRSKTKMGRTPLRTTVWRHDDPKRGPSHSDFSISQTDEDLKTKWEGPLSPPVGGGKRGPT